MEKLSLSEMMKRAQAAYEAMTPEERAAMWKAQRESWVRGELALRTDRDEVEREMAVGLLKELESAPAPSIESEAAETIRELTRERDEYKTKFEKMLNAEHELSDAYVRLRKIIPGALDTPPGAPYLWSFVEQKAQELVANLNLAELRLKKIRHLCGFVENGSNGTLKIFQDDATKEWCLSYEDRAKVWGSSINDCLDKIDFKDLEP